MRIWVTLTSMLVLLAFTVLLPPSAFFNPNVTPDEVQVPDERPCEDAPCSESAVFIEEESEQTNPQIYESVRLSWPHKSHLKPQHINEELHRPPART